MSDTKLVITGVSSVSACGIGTEALEANLPNTPELTNAKSFEFHELDADTPCYRVKDFDPAAILGKKGLRTKDLATKMLLVAAELGFKEHFESQEVDERSGLVVGTAFGSVQSIGDFLSDSIVNGVNAVNPMLFANTVINSPTGNANIRYGIKTLSSTISTGFNAGIDALVYGCDYIRSGYLSSLVVGGIEEVSYYTLMGMDRSGVLSKSGTMKPFASDADGVVMGEACALFLIETKESAKARGAKVLAEVSGYCSAFDPADGNPGFNPDGEGARYTVQEAIKMAGINASDLDFAASGANGVASGDAMEAKVISEEIGDVPVATYKAKTGECYGASSAMNIACTLADMKQKRITGSGTDYTPVNNINLVNETAENKESEYALVTAFCREGNCTSLVLKNCQ